MALGHELLGIAPGVRHRVVVLDRTPRGVAEDDVLVANRLRLDDSRSGIVEAEFAADLLVAVLHDRKDGEDCS